MPDDLEKLLAKPVPERAGAGVADKLLLDAQIGPAMPGQPNPVFNIDLNKVRANNENQAAKAAEAKAAENKPKDDGAKALNWRDELVVSRDHPELPGRPVAAKDWKDDALVLRPLEPIKLLYDVHRPTLVGDPTMMLSASMGLLAFNGLPRLGGLPIALLGGSMAAKDWTSLINSRSSLDQAKYGLGLVADASMVTGGALSLASLATKSIPFKYRAGLVLGGMIGRMAVDLIPNEYKFIP